jgi:hypothetical protein
MAHRALRHLTNTATGAEVAAALTSDGCVIVDHLASGGLMDQIHEELAPYEERTEPGGNDFAGRRTRRTGALIVRSQAARRLVTHPLAIDAVAAFLGHATTFQLHLTQMISIHPGESAQTLHRDELVWDNFPFPSDYEVQCNILWALSDYTEEMGATRLVPGSHRLPNALSFKSEDTVAAEMERGSALFYTGKLYHGGGANLTDRVRRAINITYAVGWVRQEENQYLTTPPEIARTLDDDLLRLMGYRTGSFALGYVGDVQDPLATLRQG